MQQEQYRFAQEDEKQRSKENNRQDKKEIQIGSKKHC
jgi:hypothetical protein